MKLITNVEVIERDDDRELRIQKLCNPGLFFSPEHCAEEMKIETEIVRGRMFVNSRGERVCIGIKKNVQDLIGLPFEAFEAQQALIAREQRRVFNLENEIKGIKALKFWKRLKFLLTNNF